MAEEKYEGKDFNKTHAEIKLSQKDILDLVRRLFGVDIGPKDRVSFVSYTVDGEPVQYAVEDFDWLIFTIKTK